jgi:transcriptional/translational regulatory protein YebC/TACO1
VVSWQFERKAYFSFPVSEMNYDKAFEVEVGADDVTEEDGMVEITGPVESFKAIATLCIRPRSAPKMQNWHGSQAGNGADVTTLCMRQGDQLEEMDDVQNVYSNLKMSEDVLAALEAE